MKRPTLFDVEPLSLDDPDYKPPTKVGPLVYAQEREARLEAERKRDKDLEAIFTAAHEGG